MTLRTKVVFICGIIIALATGLSWKIYLTTGDIKDAFTAFADKDMQTLHYLFNVRNNLGEHERLLYEYYSTTARSPLLVQLTHVRHSIEEELAALSASLESNPFFQTLGNSYIGITEEFERLDGILAAPTIDRDAAQASLARLSNHGSRAWPAFDQLFQEISARTRNTQSLVEDRLNEMTGLIFGFVFIVLILTLIMVYFSYQTLQADAARRRLAYFPERNPNPVFSLNMDGEIIYASPSCYKMVAMIDDNLHSVLSPDIKNRVRDMRTSENQSLYYEYKLGGHILSARLQLLPDLGLCHAYISDITDERKDQEKLSFLAYHDPVTGLQNRQCFLDDCEKWIGEQDFAFSVVLIAFLHFELIVRNLGLNAVDELLNQIGQRLYSSLDNKGIGIHTIRLYRLSGPNFAMLLRAQNNTELHEVTDRIINLLLVDVSQPLRVRRREFWLRPVIGVSFCPDNAITSAVLIGYASAALAHLNKENRQGYQTITAEIKGAEEAWLDTETAMRGGMERGEFRLHYQPKIALAAGGVCGMEALMRWDRGGYGLVSPTKFIPVAEESGLILMLGDWALNEACRQAIAWRDSGHDRFTVAVNVSAVQFQQADFVKRVEQTLLRHGLDSRYLELEITETLIMHDLERNIKTLGMLREMGLELSLDDFGTGYSSLEYLRRFPVTRLKIDKGFVTNIAEDTRGRTIVSTMIELAHHLELAVVAEGVETRRQADILASLGCDEFQGFFYCEPLSPEKITAWWQDGSAENLFKNYAL